MIYKIKKSCHKIVRTVRYNRNIEGKEKTKMSILTANQLCKTYGSNENQVKALDHISVNIEDGEFVSIIGTSGSG